MSTLIRFLLSFTTSAGTSSFRPQSLSVWSSLLLANKYGSLGLQCTALTNAVWPSNLARSSPLSRLQIQIYESSLPQRTRLSPTPPKVHFKMQVSWVWPLNFLITSFLSRSHKSSLGYLRETLASRNLPSLLRAIEVIGSFSSKMKV